MERLGDTIDSLTLMVKGLLDGVNCCLRFLFAAVLLFNSSISTGWAQQPIQTIKGTVMDRETQVSLPGATVVVLHTDPVLGTVTDANGNFRIPNVPVGRYDIQVSFVGYETFTAREVMVGSGKEVVLNLGLKEAAVAMDAVVVKAGSNKERPLNSMATLSARQLSVEESQRYAGGLDDPARLATAFAGVAGNFSGNGIAIRGNSPQGLLWQLEGVEISNPSHFANITTFGAGGITALSSMMLSNSDFFTGAFPAEYGDALSGVFDLRLRTGNSDRRESTVQVGTIGLDLSSEGPFRKGGNSTYLFNYRYSTFSLISSFLPEDAGGIRYQDLSYKLNFPLKNSGGTISFWGLLAGDKSPQKAETDSLLWRYNQDREKGVNNLFNGAVGLTFRRSVGQSLFNTTVAVSGNGITSTLDSLNHDLLLARKQDVEGRELRYSFNSFVTHKFSPTLVTKTGISANLLSYRIKLIHSPGATLPLDTVVDDRGSRWLLQAYSQWKWEPVFWLTVNAGIHTQHFTLNGETTLEPRIGIRAALNRRSSIGIAYGNHSRMEMLQLYLLEHEFASGITQPNTKLKMARANHLVLSYDLAISSTMRLKVEPYYQQLYNIPVIPDSSWSVLNLEKDWFFNDSLSNSGKGRNYGVDVTLERFLRNGYYFLFTASLFESRYSGGDGVWRSTRYDKRYVTNLLGGKEWMIGRSKANVLGVNARISAFGGDHISPLDYGASVASGEVIYDENRAFANRKPDIVSCDLTLSYRINRKSHASTWSVKILNLLGAKEYYGYRMNFQTGRPEMESEAVMVPNISYKLEF